MDDGSERSNKQFRHGLIDSSSYIICGRKESKGTKGQADLFRSHPWRGNIQPSEVELRNVQVCPMSPVVKKTVASAEPQATDPRFPNPIRAYLEPHCQFKLESLHKLKDSTRKLLYLLDGIQSKTYSKDLPPSNTNEITIVSSSTVQSAGSQTFPEISSITDVAEPALKYLETQTKALNNIYIEDDDDDCSVFKRLTRKCNCLNQQEYNDFMIHFNEDTKYSTSSSGEIIKNIRILKKFLYIGGTYTKNALIFLNEGLQKSAYAEKAEITHGCSHSDVCNVFENHSIVIMCISWPCRYANYGDNFTQNLAASFLHKLAQLEEGRRYLKYTSKITNDIKQVLRKRGSKLDEDTKESLKAVVNLLQPPLTQNVQYTYYCRQNGEGKLKNISTEDTYTKSRNSLESPCPIQKDSNVGVNTDDDGKDSAYLSNTLIGNLREIINALQQFRKYMTLAEVFTYLDLLYNFSNAGKDKTDLTLYLPSLLLLFKEMLKEYDNREMNIVITNILNNIVSKNMLKQKEDEEAKKMVVADTATEPVEMWNQIVQMPEMQKHTKKGYNKLKLYLGSTKFRQASRRKDGKNIIVVPVEKKRRQVGKEVYITSNNIMNLPTHKSTIKRR